MDRALKEDIAEGAVGYFNLYQEPYMNYDYDFHDVKPPIIMRRLGF